MFDANVTLYTPRNDKDFYILTPTQTACQIIEHYSYQLAVKKIEALIKKQPINIYKIFDYLEKKKNTTHKVFASAMSDLLDVQRKAVKSDPLRGRKALGNLL